MRLLIVAMIIFGALTSVAEAKSPKSKEPIRTKFYNFDEHLIDGEVKKPTGLYVDERQRAKFGRLLKLKKSFLPALMNTAREKVFK